MLGLSLCLLTMEVVYSVNVVLAEIRAGIFVHTWLRIPRAVCWAHSHIGHVSVPAALLLLGASWN